ncbi:MAG: response regulator, partial [Immundisolibacteraceae bacterium]|nr:response regulator [Immundisolibacteraceae bacterium]
MTATMTGRQERRRGGGAIDVLLVEDNPGDQDLTREAFKMGKITNTLHIVDDGEKAMEFLYQQGQYKDAPRPGIILLDLNLPRKDGREVLAEIKQDPSLRAIPVVVLTTSDSDKDILTSYELNANCYLTKPVELDSFLDAIQVLEQFWLTLVKLPAPGTRTRTRT